MSRYTPAVMAPALSIAGAAVEKRPATRRSEASKA